MQRALKKCLISIVIVVFGYYALRTIASVQLGVSMARCLEERKPLGKSRFMNEREARAFADGLFQCMDRRNGLFARLFFDKDEANSSLTYSTN